MQPTMKDRQANDIKNQAKTSSSPRRTGVASLKLATEENRVRRSRQPENGNSAPSHELRTLAAR